MKEKTDELINNYKEKVEYQEAQLVSKDLFYS